MTIGWKKTFTANIIRKRMKDYCSFVAERGFNFLLFNIVNDNKMSGYCFTLRTIMNINMKSSHHRRRLFSSFQKYKHKHHFDTPYWIRCRFRGMLYTFQHIHQQLQRIRKFFTWQQFCMREVDKYTKNACLNIIKIKRKYFD